MTAILDAIPQLTPYQPSLLVLALLCLVVMIQSFMLAPLAFLKEEQAPGAPLQGDHAVFSFRVMRTHSNSVENLPIFGFSLILAIVVGVAPSLVNWLAAIHLAFRLAFWAVYYSGVGKVAGGPRTVCFVGAMAPNLVLAVMATYILIT